MNSKILKTMHDTLVLWKENHPDELKQLLQDLGAPAQANGREGTPSHSTATSGAADSAVVGELHKQLLANKLSEAELKPHKMDELRALAKMKNMTGVSKLSKDLLIAKLLAK